jgi:hypothetical protein
MRGHGDRVMHVVVAVPDQSLCCCLCLLAFQSTLHDKPVLIICRIARERAAVQGQLSQPKASLAAPIVADSHKALPSKETSQAAPKGTYDYGLRRSVLLTRR